MLGSCSGKTVLLVNTTGTFEDVWVSIVFKGMHFQATVVNTRRVKLLSLFLLALLLVPASVLASAQFHIQYRHWQPYDWAEPEAKSASSVARSQKGLGWQRDWGGNGLEADYDYQPLRIRTGDPAHNGHLHRFVTGGRFQQGRIQIQGRLGAQGTSNVFRYRDFPDRVLNGRVAVLHTIRDDSPIALGIGGDHRFGSFRWLPRLRASGELLGGDWELDLPVKAAWQSPSRRWRIAFAREGDRWATLDGDRAIESSLYLREWHAELTHRLGDFRPGLPDIEFGLGASIESRVRYRDLQQGMVDRRLGNAIYGSMRLNW